MTDRPVRQTHLIERTGDRVTKTYRDWRRDEHRREWWTLEQLAEHAPGLAPAPIEADLDGEPPSITMTAVAGRPVSGRWTEAQVDLLADALDRLWSVPVGESRPIDFQTPAAWRRLATSTPAPTEDGPERAAHAAAQQWIASAELVAMLAGPRSIIGQGDPQVGNLLLDGDRLHLVDFEDAGPSDRCFELANFAEHLGTRGTGLDRLVERFDVDRRRYRLCRRLIACFWLFRLAADPLRVDEHRSQAGRVLDLFS